MGVLKPEAGMQVVLLQGPLREATTAVGLQGRHYEQDVPDSLSLTMSLCSDWQRFFFSTQAPPAFEVGTTTRQP